MNEVTLLPCPFCGSIPPLPCDIGTWYEIECECGLARSGVQICDLMTINERINGWDAKSISYAPEFVERAKIEAVTLWNRRKPLRDSF